MIVTMLRTIIILLGLALMALLVFTRWNGGDRCALWLVPSWLQSPTSGTIQPERMIRLDRLRHQTTTKGSGFDDYLVQEPIPTNVLSGDEPPEGGKYVVLLEPDVFLKVSDIEG